MKYNRLKIVYILVFINLLISSARAQTDDLIPKIIPPYPQSASLGQYGNMAIGLQTGSPNINLEIFNLEEGKIKIPVSVAYNSNGVKVDGISKQLGIDWTLIAGGVISRQINDEDDLKKPFYNPFIDSLICEAESQVAKNISAIPGIDTEKDIFSYSVGNLSGKFFFDGGIIRQVNQNDIKINLSTEIIGGAQYKFFTITDIEGTMYIFGGVDAVENTTIQNLCGPNGLPSSNGDTAWYLTKIKNISGEEVNFTYYRSLFAIDYIHQKVSLLYREDMYASDPILQPPCYTKQSHNSVYLKQISVNDIRVNFTYSTILSGLQESVQLSNISILDSGGGDYKSFEFTYYPVFSNKRVFLKEIIENNSSTEYSFSKYAFEYYNYNNLPLRNSFAQDIYGYYNGATSNTNLIYNNMQIGVEEGLDYSTELPERFKDITSNRNPNSNFVYYGMLKSITYPTKGKTEFVYEPNTVYMNRWIVPPPISVQIGSEANSEMLNESSISDITIPFGQKVKVYAHAELLPVGPPICETDLTYPWTPQCNAVLVKDEDGQSFGHVTGNKTGVELLAHVPQGTYTFRVKSIRKCLQTYARLTYFDQKPYKIMVNEPVAGVRVQKTLDYDNNGNISIKRYIYSNFEHSEISSGEFSTISPTLTANTSVTHTRTKAGFFSSVVITSSSKTPLNGFDGSIVKYKSVIESLGENFEYGGIINQYSSSRDEGPVPICDYRLRGTSYSNTPDGKILSRIQFTKSGNVITPIKSEDFRYQNHVASNFTLSNYVGGILTNSQIDNLEAFYYSITEYRLRSQLLTLSKKITTLYDQKGLNPIVTTENYEYNSPYHSQLSLKSVQNSAGDFTHTRLYYAPDLPNDPFMFQNRNNNIIKDPVITEVLYNGDKIFEERTIFAQFGAGVGRILPSEIYSAKFPNGFPDVPNVGNLQRKIKFDNYNSKNNILQYTLENGTSTSFLWGYKGIKLIAKIENATYEEVKTSLGKTDGQIESLTQIPENFRSLLPLTFITSLTYSPLRGITSTTDPKGDRIYYDYDLFGRLQLIKDKQSNLLREFKYNFKME